MKPALVLFFVLFLAQVASAGPRVTLGVDPKSSQRSIQLTGQGMPTYPTVDVTCDGHKQTIALTRTDITKSRVVATYAVSGSIAETMLRSVNCRLLIPKQDIGIGRRQIQAAWSASAKTAEAPKATTTAKR